MKRQFFAQRSLAFSFVTAMVMVGLEVSPWVALFSLGLLIWKWGVEKLHWKNLSRKVTGGLSVLLLAQILVQYRTLIGQDPSYTFLLGLSALRVMDYENERDHRFLVLLGFVLISIKALFSLDIYWIIPSGLAFAGLWYSLLSPELPQRGKILLKVFALSVPGAVILFFAFPRFVLPWAMSRGEATGQIGFSEELNPGRVAELAGVANMVFRAKLSDLPVKSSQELYWRGSVLVNSRGLSWRPGMLGIKPKNETEGEKPSDKHYEVALEPHANTFLFVLEGTEQVQLEIGNSFSLNASVFRSARPLMTTTVYRGRWNESSTDRQTPDEEYLKIPELRGRVADWVNDTKEKQATPAARIEALQAFYQGNDFTYTLNPGAYGGANELESFLFYRKRGFCEHFAGSYATLARALGIPARVIVGYQGGRYNPMGEFWRVSQRDAHAWVEIFNDGRWQRVDPTQWVAPLRLVIGAEEFFNLSEEDQKVFARDIQWRPKAGDGIPLWDRVSFLMDDLNYRWTYFLVDFDRTSQKSFWQSLIDFKLQLVVGLIFVVVLCVLIFRSLFRNKGLLSEEQVLYHAVLNWGKKQEVFPEDAETPLQYLARLGKEHPSKKVILGKVSEYYDQKAYAKKDLAGEGSRILAEWKAASRD